MRYAVKIPRKIRAYRLGDKSKAELELIREGAIKPLSGERYELFSQEAVNGRGEIALKGDCFKVDTVEGRHFPYPNKKAYFEKHHRQLYEDYYETVNSPVGVWQFGDDMCNEVKFLLENGKMTINEQNEYGYFNAELWAPP
ncbi:MAG: hypothetical protein LUG24_02925 [Clostridiales bacterium]|nr:hypothetical protein [Clostridiales bacterium]